MTQEIYIATETYDSILEKLETLVRTFDATAPEDLGTRLVMILGDHGNIWPASVNDRMNVSH